MALPCMAPQAGDTRERDRRERMSYEARGGARRCRGSVARAAGRVWQSF